MSNAEADRELVLPQDEADLTPTFERLEPRSVLLGPRTEVRRVLPNKERRMIGAWCFVDHYGPEDISNAAGMRVAPHPHTGLQTVSWLLDGEIHHRDTLGSDALVVPGQLNLMTSGAGIAHSEESPPGHSPIMHGVQLWVALPDPVRHEAPRDFTQYADLPRLERPGLTATVIIGQLADVESPATAYSPLVGAELAVQRGRTGPAARPATSTACWRSTTAWSWRASALPSARSATSEPAATRSASPRPAHRLVGCSSAASRSPRSW